MDPTMAALGQEEMVQTVQPAMHPAEAEVQGTIQQEEESLHEEDHSMAIHRVAVPIHLHLHLQATPHLSSQEEQESPADIQERHQHLHSHLQLSIQYPWAPLD